MSIIKYLVMGAVGVLVLAAKTCPAAATAMVYDTGTELLTGADFNQDGIGDVLVLDKATGNLRVGWLDGGGNLTWPAPVVSGVENAAALSVGEFLTSGQNAVAVTGPAFNRISLVNLSQTNQAPPVYIQPANGVGPNVLVTLDDPLGVGAMGHTNLLVGTAWNTGGNEALQAAQVAAGTANWAGSPIQFTISNRLERVNALALNLTDSPGFAGGLRRGITADQFQIYQFTNQSGGRLLELTNR